MKRLNQAGSHLIVVAVFAVVLGLIGFTGYRLWQAQSVSDTTATNSSQGSTAAPANITSDADLTQAAKALDDSSTQLNNNLNDTALDSDLSDLL